MRTPLSTLGLAVLATLGLQAAAWGQFNVTTGGQTSGGTFGNRTLGQGTSPGTRTLGGTGGGAGGNISGQSQQLGALGTTQGGVSTGARFLRDSAQAGQFIGVDPAAAADFVGRAGLTGGNQRFQAGLSQAGARGQGANRAGQRGAGAGRGRTELRTRVRIGFAPRLAAPTAVSSRLQDRLAESPGIEFRSSVEVALAGREATLRGVVASQHDRALAERLARLEPGIWEVKNELVVAGDLAPAPSGAPPNPSPPADNSPPQPDR